MTWGTPAPVKRMLELRKGQFTQEQNTICERVSCNLIKISSLIFQKQ
jgi:hypothetical protein